MWLIAVALVVCLVEAVLKGWFSFVLLPASLLALPLEYFLQRTGFRTQVRLDSAYLALLRYAQLASMVAVYVALVGAGDTERVLLFGFKTADLDSKLTHLSWTIFGVALTALPVLTVWLIVALLRRRGS